MTAAPPSPSGLPDVDRQWGGLAAGGAYLLVGRAGAGRSALALQTARAAVEAGERCLVISPRAPEALVEVGQDIGLDLAAAHQAGTLRLLRIPTAATLAERGSDGLTASYRYLAELVARDQPSRVVIEDFTPLVQFGTFERFQEAFSALVEELRAQGTTLVIGLGAPANDASRRLLDVVGDLVDGTIRLETSGDLALATPSGAEYPSSDGASVETAAPVAFDPAPQTTEADAEPDAEATESEPDPAPAAPPFGAPDAHHEASSDEPDSPETPTEEVGPPAEFEAMFVASGAAQAAPISAVPSAEPAPSPAEAGSPAAPEIPAGANGRGGLQDTEIVSPPLPDPSLLADGTDPFGHDPADALFEQGFLADSGRQPAAPPPAARQLLTPTLQPPAADLPPFAPLGSMALPDPGAAFRSTLDAAFAARAAGTPFVVVALRMDPEAASAAHFDTVEAGLRSSLRPADRLLVDASRARAAVVLPASGLDDGQALLAEVQAYLRARPDGSAEAALQSVAAVAIVNGRPFQTPADLLAYAIDS